MLRILLVHNKCTHSGSNYDCRCHCLPTAASSKVAVQSLHELGQGSPSHFHVRGGGQQGKNCVMGPEEPIPRPQLCSTWSKPHTQDHTSPVSKFWAV